MLKIIAMFALFVVGIALLGAWITRAPSKFSRLDAQLKRLNRPRVHAMRNRAYYAVGANPIRKGGCFDYPWVHRARSR